MQLGYFFIVFLWFLEYNQIVSEANNLFVIPAKAGIQNQRCGFPLSRE